MSDRLAQDPQLLAAAARAFATHGWAGATLERIADEAGRSRVTLHRHGVSKDALLAALTEQAVDDYRRALWPALTAPGPAADRLEQALRALCQSAERHLPVLLALRVQSDRIFHEPSGGADDEVATRAIFTEPLAKLLRDGGSDGTLTPGDDADETATVLFNMAGWTYVHLRAEHRWSPERACDGTLRLVLDGLRAR